MKQSMRRRIFLGSGAGLLAISGIGGFALQTGLRALIDDVIRSNFNDQIADDPVTRQFAQEFASFVHEKDGAAANAKAAFARWAPKPIIDRTRRDDEFRTWILESFIFSTTAVRSFETGGPIVYVSARFLDDDIACSNTLTSQWL